MMNNQNAQAPMNHPCQIITCILNEAQCGKFSRILKSNALCGGLILPGRGTVKSHTLNLLGIKSQRKAVVNLLVRGEGAADILDLLVRELHLDRPGHGIAFSSPVEVLAGMPRLNSTQNPEEKKVEADYSNTYHLAKETAMYKKVTVVVSRGRAEDVMDIARKAGAQGGTILHGRGTGAEIATRLLGMDVEPEKELVMILLPEEQVGPVTSALCEEFELNTPGHGILYVEPVLDVRGLSDR